MEAVRAPSDAELRATRVVAIALAEASAKVRTGPPVDDGDDLGLPVWAGVLPLRLTAQAPVPDPGLDPAIGLPHHLANLANRTERWLG
jgi:hypothetical protein